MRKLTWPLLLALLLTPALARAQEDRAKAEARQYFDAGKQAIDAGKHEVAIVAFEEAYKRSPRAPVVYGLAYAYRMQWIDDHDPAKLRRAVKLFRDYLEMPGNSNRAKAVEYLGELEPQVKKLDDADAAAGTPKPPDTPPARVRTTLIVSSPVEGAMVEFDGGEPTEAPAVFDTTAGKHKLRVTAPGYQPAERDSLAVEGANISVEVPLTALPATIVVINAVGAEVAVDGKVLGHGGESIKVPAGRHRVTVRKRGRYAWERDVGLARGATLTLDAELPLTRQRRLAWYLLGGGGVLLLGSALTGGLAYAAQAEAIELDEQEARGEFLTEPQRIAGNDALDRRDSWRSTTYVLVGVGVAAAATGAILYYIDTPRVEAGMPAAAPAVTPVVGAGTVGLLWQGRF